MQGRASSVVKKHPEGLRRISLTVGFHRESPVAPSSGRRTGCFCDLLCQEFCSA